MIATKNVINIMVGIYFEAVFSLFIIAWTFFVCLLIFVIYP